MFIPFYGWVYCLGLAPIHSKVPHILGSQNQREMDQYPCHCPRVLVPCARSHPYRILEINLILKQNTLCKSHYRQNVFVLVQNRNRVTERRKNDTLNYNDRSCLLLWHSIFLWGFNPSGNYAMHKTHFELGKELDNGTRQNFVLAGKMENKSNRATMSLLPSHVQTVSSKLTL